MITKGQNGTKYHNKIHSAVGTLQRELSHILRRDNWEGSGVVKYLSKSLKGNKWTWESCPIRQTGLVCSRRISFYHCISPFIIIWQAPSDPAHNSIPYRNPVVHAGSLDRHSGFQSDVSALLSHPECVSHASILARNPPDAGTSGTWPLHLHSVSVNETGLDLIYCK